MKRKILRVYGSDVYAYEKLYNPYLQDYILNLENEEKLSQLKQISIGRN